MNNWRKSRGACHALAMLMLMLLFLSSSCNSSLAVWTNPTLSKSQLQIAEPPFSEDGDLLLSIKNPNSRSAADIYMLTTDSLPEELKIGSFTALAPFEIKTKAATLSADIMNQAIPAGRISAGAEFVVPDDLTNNKYYVFFFPTRVGAKANFFVVHPILGDISPIESQVANDQLVLNWTAPEGATGAQIMSGKSLVKTPGNSFSIDPYDDSKDVNLCVQAVAGKLHSKCVVFIKPAMTSRVQVISLSSLKNDGIYKAGTIIDIQVKFSDLVHVKGVPSLVIPGRSADFTADYLSGSGSDTLRFRYNSPAGSDTTDLDVSKISIFTAENAILDLQEKEVGRSLPEGSLAAGSQIVIDTIPPTLPAGIGYNSSVSASPTFTVNWTASVDSNLLRHSLKICGSNDCSTDCLTPQFTVNSSLSVTGVQGVSYFACVQGSDGAGNSSAWAVSATAIQIQPAASIQNITSPTANGFYKAADTVLVDLHFSEAVIVNDPSILKISLATGSTPAIGSYLSGSGTAVLRFS